MEGLSSEPSPVLSSATILLTGGHGFLGSHVRAELRARGVGAGALFAPRRAEFDLRDAGACRALMHACGARWGRGPDVVIHCAGLSGGLAMCRDRPLDMRRENAAMGQNLLRALGEAQGNTSSESASPSANRAGPAFLFIGHMCMYPAAAPQPYREDALGTGPLDPVTGPYGEGKLVVLSALQEAAAQHGVRGACVVPTNLFGPGDVFRDPARAHAAGSLIERFTDAADARTPEVTNWGTGSARRDFLFVEDAASGVACATEWLARGGQVQDGQAACAGGARNVPVFNLSTGVGVSIREFAEVVAREAGYQGEVRWDTTKPDGVALRVLDPSRAQRVLGWSARTPLAEGVGRTVAWYRAAYRPQGTGGAGRG